MPSPRLQKDEDFSQTEYVLPARDTNLGSRVSGQQESLSKDVFKEERTSLPAGVMSVCIQLSIPHSLMIPHVSGIDLDPHYSERQQQKQHLSPNIQSFFKNDQHIHDSKGNSGNKPGWGYSGFNPKALLTLWNFLEAGEVSEPYADCQ